MTRRGDDGPDRAGKGRERRPRPLPGTDNLTALVAAMRTAGLRVELRFALAERVAGPAGLAIYRVVREALANAMRHAPKERVLVVAEEDDGGVVVSVTNRLPSGSRGPAGGSGLRTVRERAAAAGVQVDYGVEGRDWRVTAWLRRETPPRD